MEVKKLSGGKVVRTNPDRLPIPLRADDPKARVAAPGTLLGNVGFYVQLNECSKLEFGTPEPTLVKVLFREIDSQVYLVIGCAREPGTDVYALKFERDSKAPTIRGLKPLFEEALITLRPDLWYEGETEIVQDETLGYAVAVNWTGVTSRARQETDSEAAAGEQPE